MAWITKRDFLVFGTWVVDETIEWSEVDGFAIKKDRARRKKDHWRFDHFDIMQCAAEFELEDARNQLEKTIHLAKYFKIWNSLWT